MWSGIFMLVATYEKRQNMHWNQRHTSQVKHECLKNKHTQFAPALYQVLIETDIHFMDIYSNLARSMKKE